MDVCLDKPREECGVFGIISPKPLPCAGLSAVALLALQHRGQEGAGIALFEDDDVKCKKNVGLVSDVFHSDYLEYAPLSRVSVAHVRYSTTGMNSAENTQPIVTRHSRLTCALAHNGNLTNADRLRRQMVRGSGKVFVTTNDTEVVNMLLIDEMIKHGNLEKAVESVTDVIEGAYSLLIGTKDKLVAVRDKNGFRPLCMGQLDGATLFASESCALDALGATFVRDIEPGEIVSVDLSGNISSIKKDVSKSKRSLCVFEMVYFARPDSVIDGMSVYKARLAMGKALWEQQHTEADMVCGVPDSGLVSAYGYAKASGIPYGVAFIKNRYVGRSFIVPSQLKREETVSAKLNPLKAAVEGKRIVLVDDSIVRGTTSARIIKTLKNAGAKEIHLRIACPPFKHPCYFGVDIDSEENLIANKTDIEGIRKQIGADSLVFMDYDRLMSIDLGTGVKFCGGCFSGEYPVKTEAAGGKDKFDD